MDIDQARQIAQDYETNTWLIGRITEGLTHADSVLQLPFRANCLNWIVGHILAGRNETLSLLNVAPLWDEDTLSRYRSGSDPIVDGADARDLSDLLSDLEAIQRRIAEAVSGCRETDLARVAETSRGARPVWQHIDGLHWHETFHVGQLQILRAYALSKRPTQEDECTSP